MFCDIGPCDLGELVNESHPVARKSHTCCECDSPIEKGEKYQKVEGRWDGGWATFKTCEFCAQARANSFIEADYPEEGPPFEELWECVGMDFMGEG